MYVTMTMTCHWAGLKAELLPVFDGRRAPWQVPGLFECVNWTRHFRLRRNSHPSCIPYPSAVTTEGVDWAMLPISAPSPPPTQGWS